MHCHFCPNGPTARSCFAEFFPAAPRTDWSSGHLLANLRSQSDRAYACEGCESSAFWTAEVNLAPVMQDGCQASAGERSVSPRSENSGGLEESSTAEKAFPTRMPCFLQSQICNHEDARKPANQYSTKSRWLVEN